MMIWASDVRLPDTKPSADLVKRLLVEDQNGQTSQKLQQAMFLFFWNGVCLCGYQPKVLRKISTQTHVLTTIFKGSCRFWLFTKKCCRNKRIFKVWTLQKFTHISIKILPVCLQSMWPTSYKFWNKKNSSFFTNGRLYSQW